MRSLSVHSGVVSTRSIYSVGMLRVTDGEAILDWWRAESKNPLVSPLPTICAHLCNLWMENSESHPQIAQIAQMVTDC